MARFYVGLCPKCQAHIWVEKAELDAGVYACGTCNHRGQISELGEA